MGYLTEMILSRRLDQQWDGADWKISFDIIAAEFEEIIDCLVSLSTETWLDTAQGVWLDRIGEIVGVLRPPNEEVDNIFTVTDYDDPQTPDMLHGWGDSTNPAVGGYVYDIRGLSLGDQATDEDFLDFIIAKIYATNADASVPGIARFCRLAFGISVDIEKVSGRRAIEITLPSTGYDLRQRRYMEMFLPVVAGVDVVLIGWPEV